jgi:hypothetical protein
MWGERKLLWGMMGRRPRILPATQRLTLPEESGEQAWKGLVSSWLPSKLLFLGVKSQFLD